MNRRVLNHDPTAGHGMTNPPLKQSPSTEHRALAGEVAAMNDGAAVKAHAAVTEGVNARPRTVVSVVGHSQRPNPSRKAMTAPQDGADTVKATTPLAVAAARETPVVGGVAVVAVSTTVTGVQAAKTVPNTAVIEGAVATASVVVTLGMAIGLYGPRARLIAAIASDLCWARTTAALPLLGAHGAGMTGLLQCGQARGRQDPSRQPWTKGLARGEAATVPAATGTAGTVMAQLAAATTAIAIVRIAEHTQGSTTHHGASATLQACQYTKGIRVDPWRTTERPPRSRRESLSTLAAHAATRLSPGTPLSWEAATGSCRRMG